MSTTSDIVAKLWSLCHVLRDDGITDHDYVIQASMESSLTQLDQSILWKAFRGQLVPQDPRDEPASVLLERIREQRKTMVKALAKPEKKTTKAKP